MDLLCLKNNLSECAPIKMKEKQKEFPDDLLKIEGKFVNDYDKMNLFLEFFEKIKEIIFKRPEIRIQEVDFQTNLPETSKMLPFTYSLEINQKQYLLIINDNSRPVITRDELEDYQNIFTISKSQDGIIIVWNDERLSSIKIYKDNIYRPFQDIVEDFENKIEPLETKIVNEIHLRKRFITAIKDQLEEIKIAEVPDPEKSFKNELQNSFDYFQNRRFNEPKRKIMQNLIFDDIASISKLFSEYNSEKIEEKQLRDRLIKIIMGEDVKID